MGVKRPFDVKEMLDTVLVTLNPHEKSARIEQTSCHHRMGVKENSD
jgi:hypothetical protein